MAASGWKSAVSAVAAVLALVGLVPAQAGAGERGGAATAPIGYDVSWPQCGKSLPTGHAFGIVGVNDGIASTTNSCLGALLRWAHQASGATTQPKAQLYVNTANPGGLGTATWPVSNVDPLGGQVPNPHGTCAGEDSVACAWAYGWNRAVEDVHARFVPAARAAGVEDDPATYPWWLDVETANSWKTGGTPGDLAANRASLEGMTSYFLSQGFDVGVYSTSYQWEKIVGEVGPDSPLAGLDSWLAGAGGLAQAKKYCALPPLTPTSRVVLTQYVAGGFDHDWSCIG